MKTWVTSFYSLHNHTREKVTQGKYYSALVFIGWCTISSLRTFYKIKYCGSRQNIKQYFRKKMEKTVSSIQAEVQHLKEKIIYWKKLSWYSSFNLITKNKHSYHGKCFSKRRFLYKSCLGNLRIRNSLLFYLVCIMVNINRNCEKNLHFNSHK